MRKFSHSEQVLISMMVQAPKEIHEAARAVSGFINSIDVMQRPVMQGEEYPCWDFLLDFVSAQDAQEILPKCGVVVTGNGSDEQPFSAVMREKWLDKERCRFYCG